MTSVAKCPKCAVDITDTQKQQCPRCGATLVRSAARMNIWITALIHAALASLIMLLLGFFKPEIVVLGILIFWGTVLWRSWEAKSAASGPVLQPVTHPKLFLLVSFLILLATVAFFATLLFGSLSFQHSWERWHKYEGHPFHRADFEVQQVYYKQGQRRWSRDAYAVGLVEGNRESINAADYLQYVPGSQAELDDRVPPGTRIPVYFYPEMKGRDRVQVYEGLPPAESSRLMAIKVAKCSLLILAGTGVVVFVLVRLLRLCVAEKG